MSSKKRDSSRITKQVVMLIDLSGSMNGIPIREIEKAVNLFSDHIGQIDDKKIRYCILGYNERVLVIRDWSEQSEREPIRPEAYGGTAIEKFREEQAENAQAFSALTIFGNPFCC